MVVMRRLGRVAVTAGKRWITGRCSTRAAAVAFFAAFSLVLTLVIVIAIGGAFFGPQAVRGRLFGQLRGLIGVDGALAVQGLIQSAWLADGSTFKMLVSLVLDTVVTALQDMMWPPDDAVRLLMGIVNQTSALLLLLLGATFALLRKAMPRTRVRWLAVTLGAAVASVLFVVCKSLFGLYLARAGTVDAFGAAGSLAVRLMWLFCSASVFLYGVAFARAWGEEGGAVMPAGPAEPAAAGSIPPDMR